MTEPRTGFDVTVAVDVSRRVTAVSRMAGQVGEPRTLQAGREWLELHAGGGDPQQLMLAVALDAQGNYLIEDAGWLTGTSVNNGWDSGTVSL